MGTFHWLLGDVEVESSLAGMNSSMGNCSSVAVLSSVVSVQGANKRIATKPNLPLLLHFS